MKKTLSPTILYLAIAMLASVTSVNGQLMINTDDVPRNGLSGITIDASQQMTNFVFVDGTGVQENTYLMFGKDNLYKPAYSGTYNVGYFHMLDFGLFFRTSLGMRNAGATMVFDAANYQWDFKYIQAKLGTGYAYDLGLFNPYLGVSGYLGYLVKANQTVNNEDFDIIDSESIQKNDFGLYFSPGVRMDASDYISVYSEFSYLMGLQNIESADNSQKAVNVAYMVTLGLSFTIN